MSDIKCLSLQQQTENAFGHSQGIKAENDTMMQLDINVLVAQQAEIFPINMLLFKVGLSKIQQNRNITVREHDFGEVAQSEGIRLKGMLSFVCEVPETL